MMNFKTSLSGSLLKPSGTELKGVGDIYQTTSPYSAQYIALWNKNGIVAI